MNEYTENSLRSVFITEAITRELYNESFPQVCRLRSESNDPICLYLDSPGGSVRYAELTS